MDILVIGSGPMMTPLINKFHQDGHRLYVLTEKRLDFQDNRWVFEHYCFPYDSNSIMEVFDSVNPDLIVALGVFDNSYNWLNTSKESVRYLAGMKNLLLHFAMRERGRFLYLSSEEVFTESSVDDYPDDIPEVSQGARAMVFKEVEQICVNYGKQTFTDTIVARLDGLYDIPKNRREADHRCAKMCVEALEQNKITINSKNRFSLLYLPDAVEYICRLGVCDSHELPVYNISSSNEMTEEDAALIIKKVLDDQPDIHDLSVGSGKRIILSNEALDREFHTRIFCSPKLGLTQMAEYMKGHKNLFLKTEADLKTGRTTQSAKSFFKTIMPFIENFVFFIPFFMLNNRAVGSRYFSRIDFFLLYVILFSMIYGQQQAVISALLATAGFIFRQLYNRTGFDVMFDFNTYVWMAQLFIVGLAISSMRDRITTLKTENKQNVDYLEEQLYDIQDINSSNVRMKNVLIDQLTNHEDSIGKIYRIVSALDSTNEEEILFNAAEVVSTIMKCPDVAIYTVSQSEPEFARLCSSTSDEARRLGGSIKYMEMEEVSKAIVENRVYINKSFDVRYPLMARAIYSDGQAQLIIMLWGILWERMTLTQADMLTIIIQLIQNTIIRANKYVKAMEKGRYIAGTSIMEEDAFTELVTVHFNARNRGLTECTLLSLELDSDATGDAVNIAGYILRKNIRPSDYIGILKEKLCILLCNTTENDASTVAAKLKDLGFEVKIERTPEL